MDILFVLVPLSVLLVLSLIGALAWTLHSGQLDNLEHEGERILHDETPGPAPLPARPSTTLHSPEETQA